MPLSENELIDPELSDSTISEILYRGEWIELKHLRHNPKLKDVNEKIWTEISVDYELNYRPWVPLLVIFLIMILNLFFKVYPQSISAILSLFCIFYITYIIPFLSNLKEKARISYLDQILKDTPFEKPEKNQENSEK